MDEFLRVLATQGPMGFTASMFLAGLVYLYVALRKSEADRLADQRLFLKEALELQKQVTNAIDQLVELTRRK